MKQQQAEKEAIRLAELAEKKKLEEEAKAAAEEAEKKKKEKEALIQQQKEDGTYQTKAEKEKEKLLLQKREQMKRLYGIDRETIENENNSSGTTRPRTQQQTAQQLSAADRMRIQTEAIAAEQKAFKDMCLTKFNEAFPQYNADVETAQAALDALLQKIVEQDAKIAAKNAELAAAEEEAVLDDWDMSDNDDGDDGEDAERKIKNEIAALEQEKEDMATAQTAALQQIINDANTVLKNKLDEFEKKELKEQQAQKEQQRLEQQRQEDMAAQNAATRDNADATMRAPIVVILGHVDSGKTSLGDRIRSSNVAKGEAGGITQQIGSSFVPAETIIEQSQKYKKLHLNPNGPDPETGEYAVPLAIEKHQLPGLLFIDTPGHESFSMLRERGGDICDVAILIVDIQQGLQQQTIESIQILKARGTPFIIAVTKIDALYGWGKKPENENNPIQLSLQGASDIVNREFERSYETAIAQFAKEEINVKLFWENDDPLEYHSIVPVSSRTGEGIPDLMQLLVEMTIDRMSTRLAKQKSVAHDEFRCIVLEVKNHEGYGATCDVVLANGTIREGDRIVCAGINGPIHTEVKALLLPPANRDQRVQKDFVQVKNISAAMGFKIVADNLQRVLAGSSLYVLKGDKYRDEIEDMVMGDISSVVNDIDMDRIGVFLHASSLGSLEALITLLKKEKIPIAGFDIGPVHKSSITIAGTQLSKAKPEYALILAFDVKIDPAAQKEADMQGVTVFCEDVIYHLHDKAVEHFKKQRENQRSLRKPVFPVAMKFVNHPNGKHMIFHSSDPILVGLEITNGTLHIGTPIMMYLPGKPMHNTHLGHVLTIKKGQDDVKSAKKGEHVSVSIGSGQISSKPELTDKNTEGEPQFLSKMSTSDAEFLLENFRDEMSEDSIKLIEAFRKLKLF